MRLALGVALAAAVTSLPALAQLAPATSAAHADAGAAVAGDGGTGSLSAAAVSAGADAGAGSHDPMLQPVPPAPMSVRSWEDALVHIRARSTDLRIQMNEVTRAEAATRVALAAALPTINATGTVTHQFVTNTIAVPLPDGGGTIPFISPLENTATAGISLVQPIFAMAPWHNIGTAKENTQAARLQLEDTKRTISLGVANALVGVVTAERVAELNRIGLGSALDRLQLARRRAELGGGNQLDVVRAQQDVESARATLVTGDESLRQAREALGLALGIAGQVGVTHDLNIDGLEADARRACRPAANVDDRSDIAALKKRIDVAGRNADNVKLQFLPTLNAQTGLSTSTPAPAQSPATLWNVQGVLSWNIWDGGVRYGRLRDTEALKSSAEQQLEATRRTATVQITQARRAVEVAEKSRDVSASARNLSAEVDRLTRLGFQEGRGTSLELVIAAAALRQAEVTLALREFELVRARVLAILVLSNCPW